MAKKIIWWPSTCDQKENSLWRTKFSIRKKPPDPLLFERNSSVSLLPVNGSSHGNKSHSLLSLPLLLSPLISPFSFLRSNFLIFIFSSLFILSSFYFLLSLSSSSFLLYILLLHLFFFLLPRSYYYPFSFIFFSFFFLLSPLSFILYFFLFLLPLIILFSSSSIISFLLPSSLGISDST